MTPYVVASSECGYALHLVFCHSADKKRYVQIISGYVPDRPNEIPNKYKNKLMWQSYFFILEDLCFFMNILFISNIRLGFNQK